MNKYRFRSIADPRVYLDENNGRIVSNHRSIFARLAGGLNDEGKKDEAIKVLNRCIELLPPSTVPFNYLSLGLIENYYRADSKDNAVKYSKMMLSDAEEQLNYILKLPKKENKWLNGEIQINMAIIQELYRQADRYEKGTHLKEIEDTFGKFVSLIER